MARQRTYSEEERQAIVRSYLDQEEVKSMSQVAAEHGIAASVLSVWVRKARGLPVGTPRSPALELQQSPLVDADEPPLDLPTQEAPLQCGQAAVLAAAGHLLIALSESLGCTTIGTSEQRGDTW